MQVLHVVTAYVIRRLLLTIPVLFAIVTLVFAIRPLVPGDPVEIMFFGQSANQEVIANIRAQLGLDKSIPEQYLLYVGTCCEATWERASPPVNR